jgi:hypothetical protein
MDNVLENVFLALRESHTRSPYAHHPWAPMECRVLAPAAQGKIFQFVTIQCFSTHCRNKWKRLNNKPSGPHVPAFLGREMSSWSATMARYGHHNQVALFLPHAAFSVAPEAVSAFHPEAP